MTKPITLLILIQFISCIVAKKEVEIIGYQRTVQRVKRYKSMQIEKIRYKRYKGDTLVEFGWFRYNPTSMFGEPYAGKRVSLSKKGSKREVDRWRKGRKVR